MAAKDKKSVIRSLIENGKANGKLTTSEINDALEQLDFDVEKVDKLYDTLESLNIDIVDDIDLSDLEGKDFDSEHDEDDESLLSVDGINIDDPVKVYLKEIGRVLGTGHRKDADLDPHLVEDVDGPLGGGLSRPVRVVGQHHLVGVLGDQPRLLIGQRGA